MKIEFYIPTDEKIPTRLHLLVDDSKHVYYERLRNAFGYRFEVYGVETTCEAQEIVKVIADEMCWQSYDHGAEWRVVEEKLVKAKADSWSSVVIDVLFRVRDSY